MQQHSDPHPSADIIAELRTALRHAGNEKLRNAARQATAMLQSHPRHPDALHALGMVALHVGKLSIAAELIRGAIRGAPRRIDFIGNLGNVLKEMGRLEEAIGCYRKVLAAVPDSPVAHNNLGNTLQDRGDLDEAVACYHRAVEAKPDYAEAWTNLGNTLQKLGRSSEAVAAFETTLKLSPDAPEALLNLGTAFLQQGNLDQAIACFSKVLSLRPSSAAAAAKLQGIYLGQGRYDQVLELGRKIRAHAPGNQMATASDAFAHLATGNRDRYRYLYGMEGLPHVTSIKPPESYPDLAAFNGALAVDILAHPSLKWIRDSYDTSKRGFVYGLLDQPTPVVTQFGKLLRAAVEDYRAGLQQDPDHPFFGTIPEQFSINLWATVLNGGGYHPAHHHPGNWLSGVYYVKMPGSACGPQHDSKDVAGGLVFDGFTDLPGLSGYQHLVRRITPMAGLMVLFPSYFMHATVPFSGDDTRVSLAFDIAPQP